MTFRVLFGVAQWFGPDLEGIGWVVRGGTSP